jgi:hypothetical protein
MKRSMLGIWRPARSRPDGVYRARGRRSRREHGRSQACYRTECGKSVKGHEGKCGGTKVDGVSAEKASPTPAARGHPTEAKK